MDDYAGIRDRTRPEDCLRVVDSMSILSFVIPFSDLHANISVDPTDVLVAVHPASDFVSAVRGDLMTRLNETHSRLILKPSNPRHDCKSRRMSVGFYQ